MGEVVLFVMLFGLIGDPVEHSVSPVMHRVAFEETGIDGFYGAFNVEKGELEEAILNGQKDGFTGFNITIPHKEDVIEYCTELDETAEKAEAVNTIKYTEKDIIGYNTDIVGVRRALNEEIDLDKMDLDVVVAGAGGAAKSVITALKQNTNKFIILNRTKSKAKKLSEGLDVESSYGSLDGLEDALRDRDVDLLVNATPVGMHPKTDESILSKDELSDKGSFVVFDLVYNPVETKLLKNAREAGLKTVEGLGMLVYQGAASFEIWTGLNAPVEAMKKAVEEELK
ncbi:MAG: Shikimate 5-dehydrogenase AroE [Candidatus Methanohalarchaeum thermophilum]|uniref:Shikimate dehydrogenase (NADP(+)) n=1 Tax=Methanohalarchaeum thermophilum TaxID=1903181 RepID=A0A1Q6DSN2_METT1|nr:MAG: Shikimate 5-dehydrogenase AroE [Candidatus Methanohalarchaeum thermophilum]